MNEIFVHVTGVVATDVTAKTVDDVPLSSFRMVSTTRRFDRHERTWVDGDKTWLTVTCWRALATNVRKSVLKSERVIVTGRLKVSEWRDEEGRYRSRTEVVADAVGHDLTFGTTLLSRTPKVENLDPDRKALAAAQVAETLERETESLDVEELLTGVPRSTTSPDSLVAPSPESALDLSEEGQAVEDDEDALEGLDAVLAVLDTAPAFVEEVAQAPLEAAQQGGRRRR
jgi:single-strand DNA-binding protein